MHDQDPDYSARPRAQWPIRLGALEAFARAELEDAGNTGFAPSPVAVTEDPRLVAYMDGTTPVRAFERECPHKQADLAVYGQSGPEPLSLTCRRHKGCAWDVETGRPISMCPDGTTDWLLVRLVHVDAHGVAWTKAVEG